MAAPQQISASLRVSPSNSSFFAEQERAGDVLITATSSNSRLLIGNKPTGAPMVSIDSNRAVVGGDMISHNMVAQVVQGTQLYLGLPEGAGGEVVSFPRFYLGPTDDGSQFGFTAAGSSNWVPLVTAFEDTVIVKGDLDLQGAMAAPLYQASSPFTKTISGVAAPAVYNTTRWYRLARVPAASGGQGATGTLTVQGSVNTSSTTAVGATAGGMSFETAIAFSASPTQFRASASLSTTGSRNLISEDLFDLVLTVDDETNVTLYCKAASAARFSMTLSEVTVTLAHADATGVELFADAFFDNVAYAGTDGIVAADTTMWTGRALCDRYSLRALATSNVLRVDASGNLAIGRSNALTRLHVGGSAFVDSNVLVAGSVGVGTSNPLYPVHVTSIGSGNLSILAAGEASFMSDARLKHDVMPILGALEKLGHIGGYTYRRKAVDTEGTNIASRRSAGVLAQEVRDVFPEVVHENADGFLSVAYPNLVALLIEAIKELRAEVHDGMAALEQRITSLET